jgi:xylulokinase
MGSYIIAYDLGTGGNKSSLYDIDGKCCAESFIPYTTHYPKPGWHEQDPQDWWNAVVRSTRKLIDQSDANGSDIAGIGISGHSLGVVPVDAKGQLLRNRTPIWSDSRAIDQARQFFENTDENNWYLTTGNGFPAHLYSVFKLMWYRDHEPKLFEAIDKFLGTKDYINFKLTGQLVTDHSYASGCGVYDLNAWNYSSDLVAASGIPVRYFPEIVPSSQIVGTLTPEAAEALGLPTTVQVAAGGVDNSCMALGARNIKEGRIYNSLGTSSWIAACSTKPLLDRKVRPFVFAHVIPDFFTSATSIFAAGASFNWVRDHICRDLVAEAQKDDGNVFEAMIQAAAQAPVGANKLLFNPSLSGGTSQDDSPNIRGAFMGLDLAHKRSDLIRAAMEGIAMGLRLALDEIRRLTDIGDEMVMVGGGSRSTFWRQIFADVYNMKVVKTNIDQQAAALGAAATIAVGLGWWEDFSVIDAIHEIESEIVPDPNNQAVYNQLLPIFQKAASSQAELGDMLQKIKI